MLASTGDAVRSVMGCVTVCKLCVRQKGNGWQCDDNAKKGKEGQGRLRRKANHERKIYGMYSVERNDFGS